MLYEDFTEDLFRFNITLDNFFVNFLKEGTGLCIQFWLKWLHVITCQWIPIRYFIREILWFLKSHIHIYIHKYMPLTLKATFLDLFLEKRLKWLPWRQSPHTLVVLIFHLLLFVRQIWATTGKTTWGYIPTYKHTHTHTHTHRIHTHIHERILLHAFVCFALSTFWNDGNNESGEVKAAALEHFYGTCLPIKFNDIESTATHYWCHSHTTLQFQVDLPADSKTLKTKEPNNKKN